jgi:hypothetical protein
MLSALAIATGLLAVLDDDEDPDFNELLQRALTFENPEILLSALNEEQKKRLRESLSRMARESSDYEEIKQIHRWIKFIFSVDVSYGKIVVYKYRQWAPEVYYQAKLSHWVGKKGISDMKTSLLYETPQQAIEEVMPPQNVANASGALNPYHYAYDGVLIHPKIIEVQ